jgi:hypothetical protein
MRRVGIGGDKLTHVGQADNTERNTSRIIGVFPLGGNNQQVAPVTGFPRPDFQRLFALGDQRCPRVMD